MATLKSEKFKIEFSIQTRFEGEKGIVYSMLATFDGKPVLNSKLTKDYKRKKSSEQRGLIYFSEFGFEPLVPFFEKALTAKKPVYMQSLEPDVLFLAHPTMAFPFINVPGKGWRRNKSTGKMTEFTFKEFELADGYIQFVFFFDNYVFQGENAYGGDGCSFHIIISKKELRKFISQLKREVKPLVKKIRNFKEEENE